jgi:hypothetical protein
MTFQLLKIKIWPKVMSKKIIAYVLNLFLVYFPYFEKKIKAGLCYIRADCVCEYRPPPIIFWKPEPIFIRPAINIMVAEPVSTAYFISPSHQSVCLCVFLLSLLGNGSVNCISHFIARQRLGNHVRATMNRRSNRRIVDRVCLWVCLCIPLSLLGNN